jgi:sarcosine oxidase subunit alpha
MALIEGGQDRMGETIYIPMPDGILEAEICSCVFYDPAGERLKV